MKLTDYIEKKKIELVEKEGFRKAELINIEKCKMSRNIISTIFDIGIGQEKTNTEIEIEEVDRSKLDDTKIDAIEVVFDVVKPRCRKPVRYSEYVREVKNK